MGTPPPTSTTTPGGMRTDFNHLANEPRNATRHAHCCLWLTHPNAWSSHLPCHQYRLGGFNAPMPQPGDRNEGLRLCCRRCPTQWRNRVVQRRHRLVHWATSGTALRAAPMTTAEPTRSASTRSRKSVGSTTPARSATTSMASPTRSTARAATLARPSSRLSSRCQRGSRRSRVCSSMRRSDKEHTCRGSHPLLGEKRPREFLKRDTGRPFPP